MEEIKKTRKNYIIIGDIKRYSQLKTFSLKLGNDDLVDWINKELTGNYLRKGNPYDMRFFYEYWNGIIIDPEELKK